MRIELHLPHGPYEEEGAFVSLPACPRIGEMIQVGYYDYKIENIMWITERIGTVPAWPMLFLVYPPGREHWDSLTKHMEGLD